MQNKTRLYAGVRSGVVVLMGLSLWLWSAHVFAQADDMAFLANPVRSVLRLATNVIGPAMGIGGLILAGAMFFTGQVGAPFKIALGVVVGGVLISSAETIWTTFFHGVAVGG